MLERLIDWITNLFKVNVKEIKYLSGQKKCLD